MLATVLYNKLDTFASKLDWAPTPASGIELDGVSVLANCADGTTLAVLLTPTSAFLHRIAARHLDGTLTGLLH